MTLPRLLALFLLMAPFNRAGEVYTFAALGCMPYGLPNSEPAFVRVIDEINRHQPAFTVHLGDIKGGSEPLVADLFDTIGTLFRRFTGPLIYTPGDNEWTDVHRPSAGSHDPLVWLDRLRRHFFTAEASLGQVALPLVTQRHDSSHAYMVENARWSQGGVMFATVHVVGSNNNDQPEIPGAREEFLARDAANEAWVREVFAVARAEDAPGLALFFQANPFNVDRGRPGHASGFERFLQAVEAEAVAYGRPVLLVHADDHRYRLDRAMRFHRDGARVPNVTRLGAFGAKDMHAVLVVVHPDHPQVFLPGPLLVPGNPLPTAFDLNPPHQHEPNP
jgi:hypothetical protein